MQTIIEDCGLTVLRYERVHGGDINHSFCLYASDSKYFLKVNDATRYPLMFEKEARDLDLLRKSNTLIIPKVIKYGTVKEKQYLLLEWIEEGKPTSNFWENFGVALATLHQQPQQYFGATADNYIGSLPQDNTHHESWENFYAECRIMPLAKTLFAKDVFTKQDVIATELFCANAGLLFPQEPASLLHGDLWNGNFMTTVNGNAAIYDPAVYYGHREMDMGMTKLFGGFDQRFYAAYNEVYPLGKDWQNRLHLTQLYPLLVHAILFGGRYVMSAKEIIARQGR